MPCIKSGKGYRIRRSSGGLYPKVYPSLAACKKRVAQMEIGKHGGYTKGKKVSATRQAIRTAIKS